MVFGPASWLVQGTEDSCGGVEGVDGRPEVCSLFSEVQHWLELRTELRGLGRRGKRYLLSGRDERNCYQC